MNRQNISQIVEKAANHFLELYKDDLTNADAQVAENTIHEWWGMTEDQYEGVEYEDIKEAIMKELSSPNKFQTWAAEINKDWVGGYTATAIKDALTVSLNSEEVARIDYNNGRYTVTGTDKNAVEQLEYMVSR